jgi:hypothetical protein
MTLGLTLTNPSRAEPQNDQIGGTKPATTANPMLAQIGGSRVSTGNLR